MKKEYCRTCARQLPQPVEEETFGVISLWRYWGQRLILLVVGIKVVLMLSAFAASEPGKDPLPSWNDTAVKQAIIDYVKQVTTKGSAGFIPPEDRIATFDNDGTLWAEQPIIEGMYAKAAIQAKLKVNPLLVKQQPFKALAEKDKAYLSNQQNVLALMLKALGGTTEEAFETSVKTFFDTAHYTIDKKRSPVKSATYQPQLELLAYLRDNGFKTFICSGGTIEFVRVISAAYYGIPPEQVIGTKLLYTFDEATLKINRQEKIAAICDKAGKPVNIQWHIGKIPVFACGNVRSGGDIEMLKFSSTSKHPNFQLMINHDDALREFAYTEPDNASLNASAKGKWHVVSMKNDWKQISP